MVILYIDIKSCDFIETSPVLCWGCFSPSEVFRSVHQQVQLPSLTHRGMDPRALHCLEVRLPTVEGWQERQDCQAMAMQNPTYFFHKPLFCEAFELNSKESRGDSYNPYPTSPLTHTCSSDILNEKLMWLLTLSLAALCPVQVVKASLEHGKGNLQLWRHNHPPATNYLSQSPAWMSDIRKIKSPSSFSFKNFMWFPPPCFHKQLAYCALLTATLCRVYKY